MAFWRLCAVLFSSALWCTTSLAAPSDKQVPTLMPPSQSHEVEILFENGGYTPLRLLSTRQVEAMEAFGPEDEPMLYGPPELAVANARSAPFALLREGHHLMTDVQPLYEGSPQSWSLSVPELGPERIARVSDLRLPDGWQAWAVSATRGLKRRLVLHEPVSQPGGGTDTLEIIVGSALSLASVGRLDVARLEPGEFESRLSFSQHGYDLELSLPEVASLEVQVVDATGRIIAEATWAGLPSGFHKLPLALGEFRGLDPLFVHGLLSSQAWRRYISSSLGARRSLAR